MRMQPFGHGFSQSIANGFDQDGLVIISSLLILTGAGIDAVHGYGEASYSICSMPITLRDEIGKRPLYAAPLLGLLTKKFEIAQDG